LIEPFKKVLNRGRSARRNNSYPGDFPWLLRLGGQVSANSIAPSAKTNNFLLIKFARSVKFRIEKNISSRPALAWITACAEMTD
jgi:hypothetical protein